MPRHLRTPSAAVGGALVATLALAGCAPLSAVAGGQDRCDVPSGAGVTPADGALFGVNLDWGSRTLAEYAEQLGHRPSVAVSFSGFPFTAQEREHVVAAGEQVRANGGTLLLTLEPSGGLEAVTPGAAADLAELLASINATGVPVVVRFAHEMNGSWYAWGQRPDTYVAAFRTVADAVHAGAPGSAMMWAPNYAGGYPFVDGPHAARPGTADWTRLDTDGDGDLTLADDPYAPYYPGDDVVDWVGMSLYHWGATYPWGENEVPEAGKFAAQLTGTYAGAGGDDTAAPDFYDVYGVQHGKPVAIPETAALVAPGPDLTDAREREIKQAWWRQVLSAETAERFPRLAMVNWFEWDKTETEIGGRVRWGVVGHASTHESFVADLPAWLRLDPPVTGGCAPADGERAPG